MSCYESLAPFYDRLTDDVDYPLFADRYEAAFRAGEGEFHLLLDLCCGTGSMSYEMSRRGYELISVDASSDMLMEAREKCASLPIPPLLLLQDAAELDLYGTVDAGFCSLEGINYLSPSQLEAMVSRLKNFIRPHGLFLFDIRSPGFLRNLDGSTSVDEDENLFCIWRADFDPDENALIYGMDLFSRDGAYWKRSREEHIEYAHSPAFLETVFSKYGFEQFSVKEEESRLFIQTRRCEYSL